MIRNAAGMLNSRIAVTATTNRTMTMLAARTSMTSGPTNNASSTVAIGPTTMSSTNSGRTTFPIVVKLPHDRATTLIAAIPAGRSVRCGLRALAHARPRRARSRARPRLRLDVAAARPGGSLVDTTHDGVEGGHDRHGVGDQVVLHQEPDELQVHE